MPDRPYQPLGCRRLNSPEGRSCYATKKKRPTIDQKLDALTNIVEKGFAAVATDIGRIAMACLGRRDQTLDFLRCQIFARPRIAVEHLSRGYCPIYAGWPRPPLGGFVLILHGVSIPTVPSRGIYGTVDMVPCAYDHEAIRR